MAAPAIVVYERTGRWGSRLRRTLAGLVIGIRETRTPARCLEALRSSPGSVVLVELDGRVPESWSRDLELLDQVRQADSSSLILVVADRRAGPLEGMARELGAAHFAVEPVSVESLVAMIRRHLGRRGRHDRDRTSGFGLWAAGLLPEVFSRRD